MLEPYRKSKNGLRPEPDPAEVLAKASEIDDDDEDLHEVKEVVGSSWDKRRKRVLYLVIWKGYPDKKDWTEEPYEHFTSEGALKQLHKFHAQNPIAPKDPRIDE